VVVLLLLGVTGSPSAALRHQRCYDQDHVVLLLLLLAVHVFASAVQQHTNISALLRVQRPVVTNLELMLEVHLWAGY
jgi:NhaP-type Na+/H+ or K+/H+ antiporter